MSEAHDPSRLELTRRRFFRACAGGVSGALGAAALGNLFARDGYGMPGAPGGGPHFRPKAKRVIYMHMEGAPSQLDLFDHKPELAKYYDVDLPDSIRQGQRLTTMTSGQQRFPCAPSIFEFKRYANQQDGVMLSELIPHTAAIADRLCFVHSMHTDAINHEPAITFFQTGTQQPGRPSFGSWISYGLGSANENLPTFVVLITQGLGNMQALSARFWGSGFLPGEHQGCRMRGSGDPVLYLGDPAGVSRPDRRRMLDLVGALNRREAERSLDPEVETRIAQYEMAYRMQASVPELTDLSDEDEATLELYGPDVRKAGSFAANCLMARRLVERGVRFVQLYMRGWDAHNNLPREIRAQCAAVDQPQAALILDLERRGLLEDTLVLWGGEFGRTVYSQGQLSEANYGRDHHPRCFTIWMAGGGVQPGITYGRTDDFSYNIVEDPVDVHDLHATLLHLLGFDHERLVYRFQGRGMRLTDVFGRVRHELLALMDYSEDVWLDFIGRLHPILVHAPLGLLVALVAFELWGMLRKSAAPNQGQRRFLAFVLFASAFAAAFAGWRLEEENGYTWEGFWNHKYVALTFLGLCGCAWIAALAAWRSAYGWALFLALCVGGAAGHLGGALTHGDDFLFEPFHPREASQPAGTPATSDPAPAKDVTSEVVAPPAPPPTWYAARIAPIFAAYCVGCHGPDKQKGDLALHTGALVLAGTEHGRVVEPGDAENSLLFELVSLPLDEDDHMPPPKKPQPSAAEVAELGRWIAAGASLDAPLPAGDVAPVREVEAPPSAGDAPTNDAPPAPAEQAQAAPALDPALLAPLLAEQVHAECLDPAADLWWLDYRPRAATDDAYVERTLAPLAPHVVELSLARTQVAGACLALVATLPHLERLDLAQTRCGAALDALRDHPVLRSLNLAGVALDAGAVDVLASLPALERVYLWNTGLGEQDLALLKERRPALRVDSGEVHTAAQDG